MSDDEQIELSVESSVGERLKSARETQKMSQSQVAEKLHVTTSIIEALENQQWDKLNGRTYCRGYFLNYVKLLALPYDEMLSAFNDAYHAVDDVYTAKYVSSSKKSRITIGGGLIILFVLGLIFVAVNFFDWHKLGVEVNNVMSTDMIDAEQQQDMSFIPELESQVQEKVEQHPENIITSNVVDIDHEESVMQTADVTNADVAMTMHNTTQQNVDEQLELTTDSDLPNTNRILLLFNDDCWIEIKQGKTTVLVSEVKAANDRLEFESTEPFDLLIGRAKAVTIEFNGLPVDLTQFSQGEVARLTLGEAS